MEQATILPGFHDVHQHPMEAKTEAGASCILNEEEDLETLGATIKQNGCAYEGVDPNWALGVYHNMK